MNCRIAAFLELLTLFILSASIIWSPLIFGGASTWVVVLVVIGAAIILFSLWMRTPGWHEAGFRVDNFVKALTISMLATLVVAIGIAIVSIVFDLGFHPISRREAWGKQIFNFLARGVAQEAIFLGYLFHRWNSLFKNSTGAIFANAATFSLVHLPDPFFVSLTAAGGVFFGFLFVRVRNVFAVGLAHGVIALCVLSVFKQSGALDSMRIGPAQLTPMAQIIQSEISAGDRVGLGSHSLLKAQFTHTLAPIIEKIGGKWDQDNERINHERLDQFFGSSERVFCAITEKDFTRYQNSNVFERRGGVTPPLRLLFEQHIWKRKVSLHDLISKSPISAFRERVLLISNRAIGMIQIPTSDLVSSPVQEKVKSVLGFKNPFLQTVEYSKVSLSPSSEAIISISLPADHEFTAGVPLQYFVGFQGSDPFKEGLIEDLPANVGDRLIEPALRFPLPLMGVANGAPTLEIDLNVPYCTTVQPKLCKFKSLKLLQPLVITADGQAHLTLVAEIA